MQKLFKNTQEENLIVSTGKIDLNFYTRRKNKKISGATYFEDGTEVYFRRHPRFSDFPEHGHDYTEIMIVVNGTIAHKIGREKIILYAGDVLILNKFAKHSIFYTDREDIGFNFLLSDKYILSFIDRTEDKILKRFFEENFRYEGAPAYAVFRAGKCITHENLIENIAFLAVSEKYRNSLMTGTLSLLLEQLSFSSEKITFTRKTDDFTEAFPSSRAEKYRKAIERYISEEFAGGSLSGCARELGINEQYLSRLTKRIFGKNFKSLLIEKRIAEAEKLLSSGTLTVAETAAAVGYENVYGFNEAFRKKHGVTVSGWRGKRPGN